MDIIYYFLFSLVIFVHSFFAFFLTGRIFVRRPFYFVLMPLFAALNTAAFILCFHFGYNGVFHIQYSIISVIFLIEVLILYKGHVVGLFTAGFGILLHFFVIRAIIISVFSLSLDISTGIILLNTHHFLLSTLLLFLVHIFILILFILLIPVKYLKIITKNSELITFLFVFTVILSLLVIFDGTLLSINIYIFELSLLHLILPLSLLIAFYISLFMMFKIITLHGYKDKSSALESSIKKDKVLKDALFSLTEIFIEVNCSKNEIRQFLVKGHEIDFSSFGTYSNFIDTVSRQFVHPDDAQKIERISASAIINLAKSKNNETSYDYRSLQILTEGNFEKTNIVPDSYLWYKLQAKSEIDPISNDVIAIITIDEIHEEKEIELALRAEATIDPLTGAFNKKYGTQLILDEISSGATGALFMIDIDNFKQVNDKLGHAIGDEVLEKVSELIASQFRSNDTFVRIGGDEFIVFLLSETSPEKIGEKAQTLCKIIESSSFIPEDSEFHVTVSLGISICPTHGVTYAKLFDAADLAMYSTKNKGKNTYTIFDKTKHGTFINK